MNSALNTWEHGRGPIPVVLLNDWLGDHRTYAPALPYVDPARFRCVFTDLRGYGLNRDAEGAYTLAEAAADVTALLETLGGAHLVGHSMSSLVAQQVAVANPELVRSLVLVTPVAPTGMGTPDDIIGWLEALGTDPAAREASLGPRMAERYGPAWAAFKLGRWSEAARPEAVRGYVRMFSREAVSGTAPDAMRVLAIVGAHDDPPFREAAVRERHGAFWPTLQIEEIASGHYPMQECPPAFAAALTRFLAT